MLKMLKIIQVQHINNTFSSCFLKIIFNKSCLSHFLSTKFNSYVMGEFYLMEDNLISKRIGCLKRLNIVKCEWQTKLSDLPVSWNVFFSYTTSPFVYHKFSASFVDEILKKIEIENIISIFYFFYNLVHWHFERNL